MDEGVRSKKEYQSICGALKNSLGLLRVEIL